MNNELLYLTCEKCKVLYEKPENFKELAEGNQPTVFFFKSCITYCDECRVKEEKKYIKHLPDVIKILNGKYGI